MSKGNSESIKVFIIQLQNSLLIFDSILYEAIFVLCKCDWTQEGLHLVVIIACHNILLSLFWVFGCLCVDGIGDVTGSVLRTWTRRRSDSTEEWVSGLVGRRSWRGVLLLLTRLRHCGFQTGSQGFLMVFENLFSMIWALSRWSPHLTWILGRSSLGSRRTAHSLRGSFLTFRIHKSLHHLKFFFHFLVFCFKHLRCTHSKKNDSRINN